MITQAIGQPLWRHAICWVLPLLLVFGSVPGACSEPATLQNPALLAQGTVPSPPPGLTVPATSTAPAGGQPLPQKSIVYAVRESNEHLEMVVNTSRILTLGQKIPQVQVNNPEVLEPLILSPTEVQISGKKPGVTQVNLWGEDKKIYTIDVIVEGDARELTMLLQREFPGSAVRVTPLANGVLLSGYVDHPQNITRIRELAEEFYPKVLNNMVVGGVQQVLLHVKLMEVSRTKLRNLGIDFANLSGSAGTNVAYSAISGLMSLTSAQPPAIAQATGTFGFSVVGGSNAFFGVLNALRQDNLLKTLSEPTIVTISGRAAGFMAGGEYPIMVPQSLGTVSIDYKKFGTQVNFVPIVLGNGRIHLDVRPEVSELDPSISVTMNSVTVPGLRTRWVETGVEMTAGQTLAIAGLIQQQDEAQNSGLPWISEVPYLGTFFRQVKHQTNDIELLVLVTPEVVEAVDASQMPPCGPGSGTTVPDDVDLYLKGHLEVPVCPGNSACAHGRPAGEATPGMISAPGTEAVPAPTPALGGGTNRNDGGIRIDSVTIQGGISNTPGTPPSSNLNDPRQNPPPPPNPQPATVRSPSAASNREPSFIGPVGYDVR